MRARVRRWRIEFRFFCRMLWLYVRHTRDL